MTILDENQEKYKKLREFCKKIWNIRVSPNEFHELLTKSFSKEDIDIFILYFAKELGENPKEVNDSLQKYFTILISENPSLVFDNIDFDNPSQISSARIIIEMSEKDLFKVLPVNNEKSSNCALNALISVLMNPDKSQMKKDIIQLTQSPYFSILISSGRLFDPEKFKIAQNLFTEKDPFDCPIVQLPITQVHLVMALFPEVLMVPFHLNDKFRTTFFIFAVFQLVVLDNSSIKLIVIDSILATVFSSFLNFYLIRPTYTLSYFLNTFPMKHFNSKNMIKVKDIFSSMSNDDYHYEPNFYSSYYGSIDQFIHFDKDEDVNENENVDDDDESETEKILHFFYNKNKNHQKQIHIFNSDIIHDQLPNGILPTYEDALNFLTAKPESISMDTLIEDALHYPAFTPEVANIFMQKMKEKDYQTAANLANQILKRAEDIRITWIEQFVFFPIMRALYECLNEIIDEHQFEVLFFLFITFFEGCSKQGDEEDLNALIKFISSMNEPLRLFLENLISNTNEVHICNFDFVGEKPINRLINFLIKCKETNDIDEDEVNEYPYLLISAFIWAVKTVHPNSVKLFSFKFPDYKILKQILFFFTSCYKNKYNLSMTKTSLIHSIHTSECSFELMSGFPVSDDSEIRQAIIHHLHLMSTLDIKLNKFYIIVLSWRAWMNKLSIKKFIILLLETLMWFSEGQNNITELRNNFLYAQRIIVASFQNPIKTKISMFAEDKIKFNMNSKRFELNEEIKENINDYQKGDNALKNVVLFTHEFVNNYHGSYSDGFSIASFCVMLIISMKNNWKNELKKTLELCNTILKKSNFESLQHSYAANILFISMSFMEVQNLINIEMFDLDFLQMNWRFGINYFFIQSEIKKLKKLGIIDIK